MKRVVIAMQFVILSLISSGQDGTPGPNESYIYFYRDGQFGGAMSNFNVYVDDKKYCKISNDRWFKVTVKPGKHDIEAKIGGTSLAKKETFMSLITEGGKSYYISCDVKRSVTRARMEMEEVTESTGLKKMKGMKEDKCNSDD
jgi:hypothetical protein